MHRQQEFEGKKYYCTVSAGYAAFPEDGSQYLELVKCAKYSLEHSKLLGKDRITCFSPDILPEKERPLELMELLRESIEHGFAGFSVAYQPQVEAATGKLFRRGGAGKMDLRKVWQHIAGRIYTAFGAQRTNQPVGPLDFQPGRRTVR